MQDRFDLPEGYVIRYNIHTGLPYAAKLDPVTGEAIPLEMPPAPQPEAPAEPEAPEMPAAPETPVMSEMPAAPQAPVFPEVPSAPAETPLRYAGFFRRLAAYLTDGLVIALLWGVVRLVGLVAWGGLSEPVFFTFTVWDILGYLFARLYFVLFTKRFGATPGKMLLRLRVVSADGAPLSWWTVVYRETVGRYLTSLLSIGYLVLAFDLRHRGFHDMLADTRVCLD